MGVSQLHSWIVCVYVYNIYSMCVCIYIYLNIFFPFWCDFFFFFFLLGGRWISVEFWGNLCSSAWVWIGCWGFQQQPRLSLEGPEGLFLGTVSAAGICHLPVPQSPWDALTPPAPISVHEAPVCFCPPVLFLFSSRFVALSLLYTFASNQPSKVTPLLVPFSLVSWSLASFPLKKCSFLCGLCWHHQHGELLFNSLS